MRLCNSVTVLVGLEVFGLDSTAAGEGEGTGATIGDGEGEGSGDGIGVAAVVDLRSRCAPELKVTVGIVERRTTSNRKNRIFFIDNIFQPQITQIPADPKMKQSSRRVLLILIYLR